MKFKSLKNIIFIELKKKLENHSGLSIFVKERSKFEGWLKVELCDILIKYSKDIIPEKNRVDINFKDWGIELKTLNTNIRYLEIIDKTRPITKNVKGVISDIRKLEKLSYVNKAVLFIVFPITHDNKKWNIRLDKIRMELLSLDYCQFDFKNNIASGVMYFGLVK